MIKLVDVKPETEERPAFELVDVAQPDLTKVKGRDISNSLNPQRALLNVVNSVAGMVGWSGLAKNTAMEALYNLAYNMGESLVTNAGTIGEYGAEIPKTILRTGAAVGENLRNMIQAMDTRQQEQELYEFSTPDQNDTWGAFAKEAAKGAASEIVSNTPKMASYIFYWLGKNMQDPNNKNTNDMAESFLVLSDMFNNVSAYMGDIDLLKSKSGKTSSGRLSLGQIGSVAGRGVGQGLTMATMARLFGSKAAYGFMAGAGGAGVFKESLEKDGDQEKANTLAALNASTTYMIDRWFAPLPENIATGARLTAKEVGKEIAKAAIKEPITEGLQQTFAENLVRKIGIDAEQDLFEGVVESMIGALGGAAAMGGASAVSAYYADRNYERAKQRAVELGAKEAEVEKYRRATEMKLKQHPEAFNTVFQKNLQNTINDINTFAQENGNTEQVRKSLQLKADLEEVYNRVFDQIKTSDTDKVAAAQAKVVQGVALWGSQELGISPLEYFEQRFPRIERVAYRDFARRFNEAKRAGEVAEINLYEALKNPALLKGHKVKDTRQSLTQFLKQNGGLKDFGGELKAMDAGKQVIGLINNKNGRNLDDMALAAWEAGYFPQSSERPTVNDLLEAINEELGGRKRYNKEAPHNLENEVNQLAEDLDRMDIDWRNMEAPEIEMAVDAYMERQRAYNEEMGQEDTGDNGLAWFQQPAFSPSNQDKSTYINDLRAAERSAIGENVFIRLGKLPIVYEKIGIPAGKVATNKKIIIKDTIKKHNVPMNVVESLPELFADPLAILKSSDKSTNPNAYVAILDAKDKDGKQMIAALSLTDSGKYHFITSFYGKNKIENMFSKALDDNRVKYVKDKKISLSLRPNAQLVQAPSSQALDSLQLRPQAKTLPNSLNNILQKSDIVKTVYQDQTLYRDPKGAYSQRINRRAVISLFERADASTFMHETAHFFFEELKAFAPTSEKSAKMLKTVNDWLGSDGKTYTVEQIEQFARGFEQYLREGKAPSTYLKRVFDAFMNWMRQLYKTAKELNVKLNDEVRSVYGDILGGADLDKYMDAPVSEVLGNTKKYWKAKREAMDDIYKQNIETKKASVRLFKRGRETVQNVYTDMRNYLSDAIVPLEEEIKQISPELYNMNRRLEIDKLQKTSAYYKRIKGFVDGMQKMDTPDFYTFDLALKNRDVDTVQRLLEKYALQDSFTEVRNILDDLREQMIDVGVDVAYLPDYFPRKIKNADGLLDYVEQEFGGRPEYSIIQKMIEEKRKDGRIRTKEDEAQIVNSLIRGYAGGISIAKIGNVKERSIDVVDQHMNRFYKVSTDALIDYISGAVQMIENKKYFGKETKELQNLRRMVANRETTIAEYKAMEPKEAKWKEIKTRNYKIGAVEAQIRNTYDKDVKAELQDRKTKLEAEVEFLRNRRAEQVKEIAINRMEVELAQVKKEVDDLADSTIENSVGNLLLEMAEQGKISHTQELRLKELLLARFSNQGLGNEFWRLVRDGGYIWTLGNFESAITQFGDLGTSAYKNGLWNTVFEYAKAWRGKSEITIDDLGLGKIIQDGSFADTSAWTKALDKVLKYTGFEKMDKIAKQTLVNSAIRKARADARAEKPELEAYLRQEFGEKWVDVREDMKTGAITDEIMEYAMFQLMDVQPITIDQMPRYYAEGGKKRLFYMMKSYFIKQLNEYRRICFETAKTNPRKAVVDMIRLTGYLMLFNAGADVLKDLLFGRPINVSDTLVDNIFIGGSINRYQAMNVKREGLFKTLQKQLMFPVMLDELVVDVLSDKKIADWNTWKNVPLAGRPYYWWWGGGRTKLEKKNKTKLK